MVGSLLAKAGIALCKALHKTGPQVMGQEIADIVEKHSIGAAVSGLGSAWIPGVGGAAATAAAIGFVWSMYVRINALIGMPFSKNILKSVATAICTNVASYAVAAIALSTVFSLLPGIGSVGASLTMAIVAFSITWSAGLVYLKVLTRFAQSDVDLNDVGEEDLKAMAQDVLAKENVKKMMKQAKEEFKAAKARGAIRKGAKEIALEEKIPRRSKSGSSAKRTAPTKSKASTRSRRSKK